MKYTHIFNFILSAIIALVFGFGEEAQAVIYDISITKDGFFPPEVTVTKSDTVRWVNNDTKFHAIVAGSGPVGVQNPLNLGVLSSGETRSAKLQSPGTYEYQDTQNPPLLGKIVVVDAKQNGASLQLSPASGSFSYGRSFQVSIEVDTKNSATTGVDVRSIFYNPKYFDVRDDDPTQQGIQIKPGLLFANTVVNSVSASEGKITFSQRASPGQTFTGKGSIAQITFTPKASGTTEFMLSFTQGSVTDSNVISDGNDILAYAAGALYTITGSANDPATMRGVITTASFSGEPLTGARIALMPGNLTTVSDDKGNYSITPITPGTIYTVTVEKQGFISYQAGTILLNGGQVLDRNYFLKQQKISQPEDTSIFGVVRINNESGNVLGGSLLELLPSNQRAISHEDGTYSFVGVPSGMYDIRISRNGFTSYTARGISFSGSAALQRDWYLRQNASPSPVVFGRITQEVLTGSPIAGARVELGSGSGEAVTDANGLFYISEALPGTHRLRVNSEGFVPYQSPEFVVLGGSVVEKNFFLVPSTVRGGSIIGRVTLGSFYGEPIGGVSVVLLPSGTSVQTEENGSYRINSVAAGTYQIRISREGFSQYTSPEFSVAESGEVRKDFFIASEDEVIASGTLIRSTEHPAVYYVGFDRMRYLFPNSATFETWYSSFEGVQTISQADLEALPLGGNVTVRPGTRLVNFRSTSEMYAVERGGVLRWIPDADSAASLYGSAWAQRISVVPTELFEDYRIVDRPLSRSRYPAGTLIRYANAPDRYLLAFEGGQFVKRKFATEAAFQNNHFRESDIVVVSEGILFPDGSVITSGELQLLNAGANPDA